jgi:hypothetical protein
MEKFSKYNAQLELNEAMFNLVVAMSFNEDLNEGKIDNFANKFGMKIHKSNGLIDYIKKFTMATGKLLLAAIKGDAETVKKIATSVTKEEFIDFLLKLDMATLHLITGPIHMIDAITGWDLSANLQHYTGHVKAVVVKSVKDALDYVKDKIDNFMAPGEKREEMEKHVITLQKLADPALLAA